MLTQRPLFHDFKLIAVCSAAMLLCSCATSQSNTTANTPALTASAGVISVNALEFAKQSLADNDGWGASEGGVWGGSDAKPANIYTVSNRAQLVAALAAGEAEGTPSVLPKIIFIRGTIDMSVDDQNRSVGEAFYRDPGYDFAAYIKAYDPTTWGKKAPEGALEDARKKSAANQKKRVLANVGSNTSILGLDGNSKIINGGLFVQEAENIIIRNVQFEDAFDFFPAWDPNDNAAGEWNSDYDNITLNNASNVWVDHCTFSDGARPDKTAPTALGRKIQYHDGLLDIIRGSNYITVSHNLLKDHDKGTLVGNSDRLTSDNGKLKVTFRNNVWQNVSERSPRVRFGQVHVFNNVYIATENADYSHGYSIGIGAESRVIAENNMWQLAKTANPAMAVRVLKGSHLLDSGNLVNSAAQSLAAVDPALKKDVGWSPITAKPVEPASDKLMQSVISNAGAGKFKLNP